MAELWRIDELQQITAKALLSSAVQTNSARVRAVPDARTIRYYTTLGIIDRPAEMRGRVAYYGRRHVLQLVSIKRLQAGGMPLEDVQRKLAGASTSQLTRLAALPDGFWNEPRSNSARLAEGGAANGRPAQGGAADSREAFWAAPAAPAAEPLANNPPIEPLACVRLPLAEGVALEIAGANSNNITAESSAALRPVLDNLLRDLRRLGWIAGPHERPAGTSPSSSSDSSGEPQ
jgi:DNA-binding transcriptional MerR regulator